MSALIRKVQNQPSSPFTETSRRVVPAAPALPCLGVAQVCVAVALAGSAAGEAPLARLAVGALAPSGSLSAGALACNWVALVANRALWVAVTGWKREERRAHSLRSMEVPNSGSTSLQKTNVLIAA